jgi:hypothetical protein
MGNSLVCGVAFCHRYVLDMSSMDGSCVTGERVKVSNIVLVTGPRLPAYFAGCCLLDHMVAEYSNLNCQIPRTRIWLDIILYALPCEPSMKNTFLRDLDCYFNDIATVYRRLPSSPLLQT